MLPIFLSRENAVENIYFNSDMKIITLKFFYLSQIDIENIERRQNLIERDADQTEVLNFFNFV